MDKRKQFSFSPIGVSCLLTVFSVLCLTVFALLAVSSARAEQQLAEHTRQAVLDYYAADTLAHEMLADLRSGHLPENVTRDGSTFYYQVPIAEGTRLQVAVQVDGTDWRVLRWQAVSDGTWQADEQLPVWNGDTP